MRKLFLIRHGDPAFPEGERLCLGRTDLPLSPVGRLRACLAAWQLRGEHLTVWTSPLSRARETAAFLSPAPGVLEGLTEADMGEWDGLPFSGIRERWPELYERRGQDLTLPPPGGEDSGQVLARFSRAVERALENSRGDVALVTHAQAADLFTAQVLGCPFDQVRRSRPGYGETLVLRYEAGRFAGAGRVRPDPKLEPALCLQLLDAAGAGERVKAHCRAVAAEALRIAGALPLPLDRALLENAALLHDIARSSPNHAAVGAGWLRRLGYGAEAAAAERHQDWQGGPVDEAAVLFLADKCVRETETVSLEARFAASLEKCRTPEARAAHEERRAAAMALREEINRMSRQTLVR